MISTADTSLSWKSWNIICIYMPTLLMCVLMCVLMCLCFIVLFLPRLSFGFTEKGSGKSTHQAIGVYGNGFKSGSMRLGRDALIFTKNGGCQSVGMLSQTFLQAIKAQAVIVPITPFNQQTNILYDIYILNLFPHQTKIRGFYCQWWMK